MPVVQLTFEHVHHAEEGKREGGLPTACAAADPNLKREEQVRCGHLGCLGASSAGLCRRGKPQRLFSSWCSDQQLFSQGWARVWACFLQWIDHPSETRVHYSYPLTATNQLPHSLLYVNFIFVLLVISVYAWLLMSHGDQGGLFLVSSAFYSCY